MEVVPESVSEQVGGEEDKYSDSQRESDFGVAAHRWRRSS
jgi:hypothetical protein